MSNRYNVFDPSVRPLVTVPESVLPRLPDPAVEAEISQAVEVNRRVAALSAQYHGYEAVVAQFDYSINPFVLGGPNEVVVTSFTVPSTSTLQVDTLTVRYDDPLYHCSNVVGWRPTVNQGAIPFFGNLAGLVAGYVTSPLGDFHALQKLTPMFVQADSTLDVIVYRANPLFVGPITVAVWIIGKLLPVAHGGA